MAVTISGTLRNASGVRPNTKIILTATRTSNTVLQHAPDISITTDANGDYSFNCNPTAYVLSIQQDGYRREVVGAIMVYSDSVPGTLEDFILAPKAPDLTPEIVKQVEELRNEAAQFASQAADSAQEAKDAAASIGNASIEHGSWDASSGDFPALDGKSNWYRISVGGTLTSPIQDDMPVMVDDMVYYSTVDSKWYKVDNQAGGPSSGDMQKAVYDPSGKNTDAFDMDNMDEGTTAKILTQVERDAIVANTAKRSYPEVDEQKLAGIGDGANLSDVSAGNNITIDKSNPQNPIIITDSNLVDVIAGANISINRDDPRNPVISTDSNLVDVIAGTNINIDKTDPRNPVISSTASGSGDMEKSTYDPQGINSDAFDRANHTGEQAIDTVTGLQAELNAKATVTYVDGEISKVYGPSNKPTVADVTGLSVELDKKENSLGNPSVDGMVLSSLKDGTRSWVANSSPAQLDVVILAFGNYGNDTVVTLKDGREWSDFYEVMIGFDNGAQFQTVAIPHEYIEHMGGTILNAIIRQGVTPASYVFVSESTTTTAKFSVAATANGGLKFVKGKLK